MAHIFLSGPSEGIMVGNFIGDAIKGNAYNNFPDEEKKGILLHRKIDHFTDNHPVVTLSKEKLRSSYGKHAGIVIDIFYDHFFSINWNKYSGTNRNEYIQQAYKTLLSRSKIIPTRVMRYLPYMVLFDWLGSYINIQSIKMVLDGMARRTSLPDKSDEAIRVLEENHHVFDNEFNTFFPEIVKFVQNELNKN